MNLFGRRQTPPEPGLMAQLMELGTRIASLESEVRTLRAEVALTSDLVTKRMRRAVAAERAVERHQEHPQVATAPPAGATPARPRLRGARLRAAMQGRVWGAAPTAENGTQAEEE